MDATSESLPPHHGSKARRLCCQQSVAGNSSITGIELRVGNWNQSSDMVWHQRGMAVRVRFGSSGIDLRAGRIFRGEWVYTHPCVCRAERKIRLEFSPSRFTIRPAALSSAEITPSRKSGTSTAAFTTNGIHWQVAPHTPAGYRSTVAWNPSDASWIAAGSTGSDISHDNGNTWQPLDHGNWNAISLPFVVGPDGRIARLISWGQLRVMNQAPPAAVSASAKE